MGWSPGEDKRGLELGNKGQKQGENGQKPGENELRTETGEREGGRN